MGLRSKTQPDPSNVSRPMRNSLAVLFLSLVPVCAIGGGYNAVVLSPDQAELTVTMTDGSRFNAPRFPDQVAFAQPQVSPDGKNVGWLAQFPNCCTSYPIALKLVVLAPSRQLHTFEGKELAIFNWCFVPGSASVAYTQSVLHGSNSQHFERRAVSDGRLLDEYEYPHDGVANMAARKRAPAWVKCADQQTLSTHALPDRHAR
jgi:hypothetical protein